MNALRLLSALLVVLLLAPVASAEYHSGPHVATVGVGPAFLDQTLGTGLYVSARFDLGTFNDKLGWDAGLHWWKKSETTSITAYDFSGQPIATSSVETSARDLALFSGVKFSFPVNSPKMFPYARGGLGLNFVDVSVESQGISVSGGDTDLGIYLGGGFDYLISSSMMIGGELIYHATDADHTLLGVTMSFPLGHQFRERTSTSSAGE